MNMIEDIFVLKINRLSRASLVSYLTSFPLSDPYAWLCLLHRFFQAIWKDFVVVSVLFLSSKASLTLIRGTVASSAQILIRLIVVCRVQPRSKIQSAEMLAALLIFFTPTRFLSLHGPEEYRVLHISFLALRRISELELTRMYRSKLLLVPCSVFLRSIFHINSLHSCTMKRLWGTER